MIRYMCLCVLAGVMAGLSVTTMAREAWQSPAFLQQAFSEIALRNEFSPGEQAVRKWRKPIKVWLVHHVDQNKEHTLLTTYHLNHLASITGLPISMARSQEEANFTVVFTHLQLWRNDIALVSGNLMLKPPNNAACMFGIDVDDKQAIKKAWVVIPVDFAQEHRLMLSCIVEETTQAMGLTNDSDRVFPSIFNDRTPEALLTGLDGLLLKMLYHPRVKVGMRSEQVQPVLAEILQQWQQDGTIDNAERNIRQSELYEMMGY